MTRSLILAAAAAVLPGAALAQTAPAAPNPIPRAAFIKNVDTRFGAIDTNHDGNLSKAEVDAEQNREAQLATANFRKKLQDQFTRLDTNKDRQLSLQEFIAVIPTIRPSESTDQVIARLDSNHDGKISAEEYRAPQAARFARIDTNHDGVVSPAELKASGGK